MAKVEAKKSDRQNPKHNPRPKGKACMSRKPKVDSIGFWNKGLPPEERITRFYIFHITHIKAEGNRESRRNKHQRRK